MNMNATFPMTHFCEIIAITFNFQPAACVKYFPKNQIRQNCLLRHPLLVVVIINKTMAILDNNNKDTRKWEINSN